MIRPMVPATSRFKPDASLREVDLAQPRLDVSAAGPGSDQELWLLQLPLEVRDVCLLMLRLKSKTGWKRF